MNQNNKPQPRLLLNLFEQLDSCGNDPIILRQDDVPTADKTLFANLTKQGLFKESISQTVTCISCNGIADVSRSGPEGEKQTAICGECPSVFPVSDIDLREYRTNWKSLAKWLSGLFDMQEPPESVCNNVFYIGDINCSTIKREIYLARCLAGKAAEDSYAEISKSFRHNSIVISLSKLPEQPANKRLSSLSISSLLSRQGAAIGLVRDQLFTSQTDPTKSRAARGRWDDDPLQAQKRILKANVTKKLATEFAEPLTHDQIYTAIKSKYPAWLIYTDHKGTRKSMTDRMGRSQVAEVLEGIGGKYRINGKFRGK